ncbi:DUF1858 domain-containing protein [Fundicoccus culcitae]|uniref:DUF1858 domain-containing protein n=1 Tax=Fundicoccus culcitae TaxID=2969821 RepID=A0ABY5P5N0_9LACT|nr:DUF1858 domain-containing protein [Fundicoccus culcitae]UUX33854.1 DUF1858 domain-containing protein [Fundicoccus culcitae]
MQNEIDLNISVYETLEKNPELIDLLVELGFTPLKNPLMRQTVGKATTLKQGCKMLGIDLNTLTKTLQWNGYKVIG